MQWDFCKYVLSKKVKTDIANKSAFQKINSYCLVLKRVTYASNLEFKHCKQLNRFLAVTLSLLLFSKGMAASTFLLPCVVTPDSFQT